MPGQKKVVTHNLKPQPIKVPEPVHRLYNRGPENISVREFPQSKSSAQQIKEICLHYVDKCSGQYIQSKTAARYVHQMADEILNQISGLISQMNRLEAEPESYQKLLQEFRDVFPTSLSSPKQVADKLNKLQEDNKSLMETIESLKLKHKIELNTVSASVDQQVKAYRDSILQERLQNKKKLDDLHHEYQTILSSQNHKIDMIRKEIELSYEEKLQHIYQQMNVEKEEIKQTIYKLENELMESKSTLQDYEDEILQKDAQLSQLQKKLDKMEVEDLLSLDKSTGSNSIFLRENDSDFDEYDDRSVSSSASSNVSSASGRYSNTEETGINSTTTTTTMINASDTITGTPIDTSVQGEHIPHAINTTAAVNVVHQKLSKKSSSRHRHRSSEKALKYIRIAKILKKQIKDKDDELMKLTAEIDTLKQELHKQKDDYHNLKKELHDLQNINVQLKKALKKDTFMISESTTNTARTTDDSTPIRSSSMNRLHMKNFSSSSIISPLFHPLCHTPHFLEKSDKLQLIKNPQHHRVSGYQIADVMVHYKVLSVTIYNVMSLYKIVTDE